MMLMHLFCDKDVFKFWIYFNIFCSGKNSIYYNFLEFFFICLLSMLMIALYQMPINTLKIIMVH